MAYDGARSYLGPLALAAQNIVCTASGAVATSTLNASVVPINEPTTVVSFAVICTASSGSQPSGVKYVLLQTNTTTVASVASAGTLNLVSTTTLLPGVAVAGGTWLNVVAIGTGTASATETASAVNFIIGLAPQFV